MEGLTPITAVLAENPYPYYARLVEERPFYYDDELRTWVASSMAVVDAVLSNDVLRVRPVSEPIPAIMRGSALGEVFARMVRMNDGARHDAMRLVVRRMIEEPERALAGGEPRTDSDLLHTWMFEYPTHVVASMLGVPREEQRGIAAHARALARAIAPNAQLHDVQRADASVEALHVVFSSRFHDENERANAIGLLFQTYDATAGLIGNTLYQLCVASPEVREEALRDRTTLARFVAEVLRLDPPVHNTRRFAAGDTVIDGTAIPGGETILVLLAAAGCTFGLGIHACIAAQLATELAAFAVARVHASGLEIAALKRDGFHRSLNVRIPRFAQ
ncbi:MAG TPA: cytochrome P450 [Candidatus Baltobacteraceae bacterium]|nr:cytochrome P450 [Candidatus Baltobacteraceae bacterium]